MSDTELSISRRIDAPRSAVWAAWADPRRLEEWFCPRPWRAEVRAFDLRPGGAFGTVMHGPDGERMDEGDGCFLEVVPGERVVFTSALGAGLAAADGQRPALRPADDGHHHDER